MYYVYNYDGVFVAKVSSYMWAVKMADYYSGWIENCEQKIVYDATEIFFLID